MSTPNPYEQLGVTEDASFDEIQGARDRLLQEHESDRKRSEAVEMAYDAVLMDRLRLRQEGRIKVPDRIRFPERVEPKPAAVMPKETTRQMPGWLRGLLDRPTRAELLWPSVIYGAIAGASVLAGAGNPALLQLLLSVGVGSCVYFLNRKERRFGRSVLLSVLGLVVGLILGTAIASIPLLASLPMGPEPVSAVVTVLALWLTSNFLR